MTDDVCPGGASISGVVEWNGEFLLTASPRPFQELVWGLPTTPWRPGESIQDAAHRVLRDLCGVDQSVPWKSLGEVEVVGDDGIVRSSVAVLLRLPEQAELPAVPGSAVWRSLLAGPPDIPAVNALLRQSMADDPDLLGDAVLSLSTHVQADRELVRAGPAGRDPRWWDGLIAAVRQREELLAASGARECFRVAPVTDGGGRE